MYFYYPCWIAIVYVLIKLLIEALEKPKKSPYADYPPDAIVDVDRYELHKFVYGEERTENWRKQGKYTYVYKDTYAEDIAKGLKLIKSYSPPTHNMSDK